MPTVQHMKLLQQQLSNRTQLDRQNLPPGVDTSGLETPFDVVRATLTSSIAINLSPQQQPECAKH